MILLRRRPYHPSALTLSPRISLSFSSLGVLSFLSLLSLATAASLTPSYPVDDAYITYRHAQNWLRGFGPVFNPGDNVDASSSFLHVLLLTFAGLLGADLVVTARLLNLLAAAIPGTIILLRYASPAQPPVLRILALLAATLLALTPHTSVNINSGLEAPVAAALLYLATYLLLTPLAHVSPLVFLLSSLARPEHAFIAALLLFDTNVNLPYASQPSTMRQAVLRATAIAAGLYTVYQAGHAYFYQALLPNSVYAKSGFPLVEQIARSVAYESAFLKLYVPIIVTILVLCFFRLLSPIPASRPHSHLSLRPVSLALSSVLVLGVILGSGDPYIAFARYLYPALPLALELALALAAPLLRGGQYRPCRTSLGLLLPLLFGIQLIFSVVSHPTFTTAPLGQSVPQLAAGLPSLVAADRRPHTDKQPFPGSALHSLAEWLLVNSQPGALLATSEIGIVAYYTDVRILDTFGLADRRIARSAGVPGGKTEPDYVFGRSPDYIAVKIDSTCFCGGTPGDNRLLTDYRILSNYDVVRLFPAGDAVLVLFQRRTQGIFHVYYDFVREFDYARVSFVRADGSAYSDSSLARQVTGSSGVAVIMTEDYRDRMITRLRQFLVTDAVDFAPADLMREWLSQWRALLYHHPVSNNILPEIGYRVYVPASAVLEFAIGTDPNFWSERFGDGVEYQIVLDDGSGPRSIFSEYVDAKRDPADRGWKIRSLDLSRWADREVEIAFVVKPGPHDDQAYDFGGWGLPQIRTYDANAKG